MKYLTGNLFLSESKIISGVPKWAATYPCSLVWVTGFSGAEKNGTGIQKEAAYFQGTFKHIWKPNHPIIK